MYEADYLALRDSLRERSKRDALDVEFIRRFIIAVQHDVDKEAGLEQSVCFVGLLREGAFLKGDFDAKKGVVKFAVQVLFHSEDKRVLYSPVVEFTAKIEDSSTLAVFYGSTSCLRIAKTGATTPEGRRPALFALNEEIKRAVEEMLSAN